MPPDGLEVERSARSNLLTVNVLQSETHRADCPRRPKRFRSLSMLLAKNTPQESPTGVAAGMSPETTRPGRGQRNIAEYR